MEKLVFLRCKIFHFSIIFSGMVFVFFISFSFASAAVTIDHADVITPTEQSGVVWRFSDSGQIDGAVTKGSVEFDVTGLSQDNEGKRQLFAMMDAAQPSPWDNYGYWIQFRKRENLPSAGGVPGFELKDRINCVWSNPANEGSSLEFDGTQYSWVEDHVYHITFSWTMDAENRYARVIVEDTSVDDDGEHPEWEVQIDMDWPFYAQDQVFVFGWASPASPGGMSAEPGAHYTDIEMTAEIVDETIDTFGGYPPCETEPDPYDGPRQDEPGTDSGDPYDDESNIYDHCACTALEDGVSPPCEDERAGDASFNLKQSPFKLRVGISDWGVPYVELKPRWGLDHVLAELFDYGDNEQPDPSLDIEFAPPSVSEGDDVIASAIPQNFKSMMRNIYFNWCLTDINGTKSYNETLANGNTFQAKPVSDVAWDVPPGGCCIALTRDPADDDDVDTDGDGMGDNWEMRYFAGATIEGYTLPTDRAEVLALVNPNDDLDQDGYLANKYKNADGDYVTVTPALQDHLGNKFFPGAVDDGAKPKLTNVEEYILGTNPLDGDSDNDGYGDEMDYIGVGAMTFPFEIDMPPGPGYYGYLVHVSAVGVNNTGLVGIAGRSRRFDIPEGTEMQLTMTSSPNYILLESDNLDNTLGVDVSVAGGDVLAEDLVYTWNFDGHDICDDGPNSENYQYYEDFGHLCDVGQDHITLGADGLPLIGLPGLDMDPDVIEERIGTTYNITVTGLDPQTRRTASATLELPITRGSTLTTACSPDTQDTDVLPANMISPVTICTQGLESLIGEDPSMINFQWYVDGTFIQGSSGAGRDSFLFMPTALAGETQSIMLDIVDVNTEKSLAMAERTFRIEGPELKITWPLTSPVSYGLGPKDLKAEVYAGDNITATAFAENFPAMESMVYEWSFMKYSDSGEDMNSYELQIPENSQVGDSYDLSVIARGTTEDDHQVLNAGQTISLVVVEQGAVAGAGDFFGKGLAKVAENIPMHYQIVFRVVGIGIAIFSVGFLVFRLIGVTTH